MKSMSKTSRMTSFRTVLCCCPFALALLVGGCPPGGSGSLVGTWAGDVAYVLHTTLGGAPITTTKQTNNVTVTFDSAYKPDKTIVPLIENPVVIAEVPLTNLSKAGDTATVSVDEQGTQRSMDVTVTSVNSTATKYELELSVTYHSGLSGAVYTGTHSLTATLNSDNTVTWQTDTTVTSGSGTLAIGTTATSDGTLAKQ